VTVLRLTWHTLPNGSCHTNNVCCKVVLAAWCCSENMTTCQQCMIMCFVAADCWSCTQYQQCHSWPNVTRMGQQYRRFVEHNCWNSCYRDCDGSFSAFFNRLRRYISFVLTYLLTWLGV